ncbi:hypothetical protein E2C01_005844 [Portunus trituberculatus]|uniref:Uncharacterized protein n=1 Tax=Portunus trituberculatus TaxID=210409 RepID=A0A5B7CVH3_PORTR|nr:hypothetical protein [Portunus trituberculatus]
MKPSDAKQITYPQLVKEFVIVDGACAVLPYLRQPRLNVTNVPQQCKDTATCVTRLVYISRNV